MDRYLWYFHATEEGFNPISFIIKSPDKRVNRIPITPLMLADFANSKVWDIDYPPHKLPKYRYDIIVSNIVIILIVLIIIYLKFFE